MARSKTGASSGPPGARAVVDGAHAHRAQPRSSCAATGLDELMGRVNFGEAIYLLLTGELPTPSIGRLVNAMLVSFIDHGVTPPSTLATRNAATTGASLRGSVAAGILGFGRHHGGDALACRQLLDDGLALVRTGETVVDAATDARGAARRDERDSAARVRPPVPLDRSAGDPAAADRPRARGRSRVHAAHPRARDGARASTRNSTTAGCP